MGILCGVSLACAVHTARVNPTAGYFITLTRLHELGLSGLMAVWATGRGGAGGGGGSSKADGLPLQAGGRSDAAAAAAAASTGEAAPGPHLACTLAAAAGPAAIAGAAFLYWPGLPFPGVAALVPALGVAAFILAGEVGGGGEGGGGGGGAADVPPPHVLAPALVHPWLQ